MSKVMYGIGATTNRLIPAPLVNISKSYERTGGGDIIGKTYSVVLTGTIVAHMGSPDSNGDFWTESGYPPDESVAADERLGAVLRKQEAIRKLFSVEGKLLEIQSADGSAPLKCNPRVISIDFPEGIWYERSEYTITLECDTLTGLVDEEDDFTEYIESATEEWAVDTNEDPQAIGESVTYSLSHNISAVGRKHYEEEGTVIKEAWQYAQDYVLSRLGFDAVIGVSSGVNNLPSYYNGWNHRRSSTSDKAGGSYSVNENWLMASGNAIEDFTITTSAELESPYDRISIQGSVTGFEARDADMNITTTKWVNAEEKFDWVSGIAFIRAQTYSGASLNVEPLSTTIGRNPFNGTIDYTIEYDARPLKLIEGAKSESISINDNIGGELFASVFVLGRARGPVLQDLGTKPANTRGLNIEIVVEPPTPSDRTLATIQGLMIGNKPMNNPAFSGNLNTLVAAANPLQQGFTTVFQDQPQENWDFVNGRYSYNTTWTYE